MTWVNQIPNLNWFPFTAPSAPPSLQIVSLTSSQVVLTWLEPVDKNGVLLGYEVYYRSTGSQSDSTLTTNDTRILVDDLDSGTNYTASVAARTAYGTGLKSYTITFRTSEDGWIAMEVFKFI